MWSSLDWTTRPHVPHIIDPFDEDLSSASGVYGVQAGLEYMFSEHWSLFAKYQYLKYNEHIMEIDKAVTTIEHNSVQNILAGVRYAF